MRFLLFLLLTFSFFSHYATAQEEEAKEALKIDTISLSNHEEALALLDKLLAQDSLNEDAYLYKALVYQEQKKYMRALGVLSAGIGRIEKPAVLYQLRGELLGAMGSSEVAIEDYSQAIRIFKARYDAGEDSLNTTLKSLHSNRGAMLLRIRKFETSLEDFKQALAYDSTDHFVYINYSLASYEVGDKKTCYEVLNQLLERFPDLYIAYINYGYFLQREEKYEEALPYLDKAVELNPNEALCYSNRSLSRLKTGDLAGAMKDINISLSLYKTNSYAYKVRGLIYLEKNMNSAACQDFNEALRLGYTEEHGGEVRELVKEHCN